MHFCWKNHQRFCPRCHHRKLYPLAAGRRRCAQCGYTFHDFSRRFINNGNLTPKEWLWILKLFELEVPAKTMAEQLGLAYNTVVKALKTIRGAIMAHALDATIIFDVGLGSSLGTARTKKTKKGPGGGPPRSLVFGVVEQGGWTFVDLVPELTAETIMHFKTNFHLKTSSIGSIIYTDRYRHYATLIMCDPVISRLPHLRHRDKGLLADTSKGFWSYAKERLRRHQGVISRHFPLYIKELEFRYNHRNEDIFPLLAAYLCGFVPRLK